MSGIGLQPENLRRNVLHDGNQDVGGLLPEDLKEYGKIDVTDKKLQLWELQIHALLVLLSVHQPPYMTVDELRRGVEALEPDAYINWGYYERWAVSISTILWERNIITQKELNDAISGDEDRSVDTIPTKFQVGDLVRVKKEDTRLRWR
jgi:hypothetical protein